MVAQAATLPAESTPVAAPALPPSAFATAIPYTFFGAAGFLGAVINAFLALGLFTELAIAGEYMYLHELVGFFLMSSLTAVQAASGLLLSVGALASVGWLLAKRGANPLVLVGALWCAHHLFFGLGGIALELWFGVGGGVSVATVISIGFGLALWSALTAGSMQLRWALRIASF